MTRSDVILWLDLETTGSKDDALILEVGMAVTGPGPDFRTRDAFSALIWNPARRVEALQMEPVVEKMHTDNGLLVDLLMLGQTPDKVEQRMIRWTNEVLGESTEQVVLAGSGIAHFDRKYVKRDWPWLDQRLAYYMYDTGVLRRMLRMVGIESTVDQEHTPHRALDDVFQHIRETRELLRKVNN